MDVIEIDFRENELPITHAELRGLLHSVLGEVRELRKEVLQMGTTLAALNTAVAQNDTDVQAVLAAVTTLATAQTAAFTDLLAEIAANPTADFTEQVTTLANDHTTLTNALAALTAATTTATTDDPGAQTSTTTEAGEPAATTAS